MSLDALNPFIYIHGGVVFFLVLYYAIKKDMVPLGWGGRRTYGGLTLGLRKLAWPWEQQKEARQDNDRGMHCLEEGPVEHIRILSLGQLLHESFRAPWLREDLLMQV
jgi:hypothetical protein